MSQMNQAPKPIKRPLNGLLLLDKATGLSSNQVLQRVKWLFQAKKAGHTGSLDPLATGMLPLCFGKGTRLSRFLLDADKTYQVTLKLGVRTASSDSEGEVVSVRDVPELSVTQLEQALDSFRGELLQTPSMYSALKYQGKPLYHYARRGIDVPRPTRPIHVFENRLLEATEDSLRLQIHCSKGTYIRTLVDDLGELLGCGAHVTALRRLSVAHLDAYPMHTPEEIERIAESEGTAGLDRLLLPLEKLVLPLPAISLSTEQLLYLKQGQVLPCDVASDAPWLRVHQADGQLMAIAALLEKGSMKINMWLGE